MSKLLMIMTLASSGGYEVVSRTPNQCVDSTANPCVEAVVEVAPKAEDQLKLVAKPKDKPFNTSQNSPTSPRTLWTQF